MSPEAWAFFSVLVTTQGKTMVDMATLKRRNQPDSDPGRPDRVEGKIDRIASRMDQHIGNPEAHAKARSRVR